MSTIRVSRTAWITAALLILIVVASMATIQQTRQAEAQLGSVSAFEIATVRAVPNPAFDGSVDVAMEVVFTTNPTTTAQLTYTITATDGPLTIRTKKTDAVLAHATAFGLDVTRGRVILVEMQRGL